MNKRRVNKRLVLGITTALAALGGAAALAADVTPPWNDEVGQWFVAPFVGYTWLDGDRLLEDDVHYGASLGRHLSKHLTVQLTGYTGDYDNDGLRPEWTWPASFNGSITGASLDLMGVFARESRFSPYLLAGAGVQSSNYEGLEGDDNVALSVGLGALWDLWRSADGSRTVQLRPEARTRFDFHGDSPDLYRRPMSHRLPRRRRHPRRPRSAATLTQMASAMPTTNAPAARQAPGSTRWAARWSRRSSCCSISTARSCAPNRSRNSSAW